MAGRTQFVGDGDDGRQGRLDGLGPMGQRAHDPHSAVFDPDVLSKCDGGDVEQLGHTATDDAGVGVRRLASGEN